MSTHITSQYQQTSKDGIYFFNIRDPYYKFSNYWVRSNKRVLFIMDDKEFISSEHAYQYYKFAYEGANTDTLIYAELIRTASTPNDARLLGQQQIKGGYQSRMNPLIKQYRTIAMVRPDWDEVKIDVMYAVIYQKFIQNADLKELLLQTNNRHIYENSPYDAFWGVGSDKEGRNELGKLLEQLRDLLLRSSVP